MTKKTWPMSFAIAHRGASQLAPENTLAALKAAKQQGACWVECDIQLTKDHQPVILHDDTLGRTTNGRGYVSATSFSRLQLFDAGSWFSPTFKGVRVPTLSEWLQTAAALKLALNLEIKTSNKKEAALLADCVVDHLQKYWPAHSKTIFMSSGDLFALMQLSERAKSLPLGLISEEKFNQKKVATLLRSTIVSVHQPFEMLDENYIEMLHDNGLQVLAYTVNDLADAQRLKSMGVDGIFTDSHKLFSFQ